MVKRHNQATNLAYELAEQEPDGLYRISNHINHWSSMSEASMSREDRLLYDLVTDTLLQALQHGLEVATPEQQSHFVDNFDRPARGLDLVLPPGVER